MNTIKIAGISIAPGTRTTLDLPVGQLYTHETVNMPVHVVHGKQAGPCVFISAAIHGDELNGIEIVRRLITLPALKKLSGTLLAIPVVNVLGAYQKSRYLPDRRDLNRSFPGSDKGSLASRLAHTFLTEIVSHAQYGIDLHTGAIHRDNFPQLRADLDDTETRQLAAAFGAPVLLNSAQVEGSLRQACAARDIRVMVYEAGEALRFDEIAIRTGVTGIVNVLRALDMLPASRRPRKPVRPLLARESTWLRAPGSGILRAYVPLGGLVDKDQLLGVVAGPLGENALEIRAPFDGFIIGRCNLPLIHEGEAAFHLARLAKPGEAEARLETFKSTHTDDAATLGFLTPTD